VSTNSARAGRDRHASILGIGAAAALLAACAASPPPLFYRLEQDAAPATPRSIAAPEVIAVAAVRVPERVDRPQIVVEDGADRDLVLQSHRWSEPLPPAIERLLAERLQRLRPDAWIETDRSGPAPAPTVRVTLVIDQLGARLGGTVTVAARWEVRDLARDRRRLGAATVEERTGGAGYDELVAAIRRALAAACDAAAASLDALAGD
jgi:uncharacterized lipoprotein YmbA